MIGIDEVGRGCWAGPLLVVAARTSGKLPGGLDDSKKLTALKREQLMTEIRQSCDIGEGWVSAAEIDALGLADAMRYGVKRALKAIGASDNEEIIMDGSVNYCSSRFKNVRCVPRADSLYPVVSAASIYAKVLRDRHMQNQAHLYPGYGFEAHVGYGTAKHQAALASSGVCYLHRRSFKPIKAYLIDEKYLSIES